ncbi:4'-phosphopantetheine phosphatase-like isoform X1 [Anopheles stephensi]|uniref:4'-phosphopantetheine phosphatase-like isoform X1 n=2 Tax=Anopheles stephensi TaxID=30069 RepID=UPI001658A4FD|nr:4'-phosphopantetheine phosphatase-like isoform X1 [Anopheles stephensi]
MHSGLKFALKTPIREAEARGSKKRVEKVFGPKQKKIKHQRNKFLNLPPSQSAWQHCRCVDVRVRAREQAGCKLSKHPTNRNARTGKGRTMTNQGNPAAEGFSHCTLLASVDAYNPDTLDLYQDLEANRYWFACFNDMLAKFERQAMTSQSTDASAKNRAQSFREHCVAMFDKLQQDRRETETLGIRNLLEVIESGLRKFGFDDPWKEQKTIENKASVGLLKQRLQQLDSIASEREKWTELVRGVLAGNMFDWGAQAVTKILETNNGFGLQQALDRIQKRPWLIDDLDGWLNRMQHEPPHRCATIFTDNAGIDFVLGIVPLVRELLKRNTKVLLCATRNPAINDITYSELTRAIADCCKECDILRTAYSEQNRLLLFGNDQIGPCLDFRMISKDLAVAIEQNKVDLLIIVGMARALHTNLYAKFVCETFKLAVVKNEWLAKRLGGETFSVVCKYER